MSDINPKTIDFTILTVSVLIVWIISIIEGNGFKKSPIVLKYVEFASGISTLFTIIFFTPAFAYLIFYPSYSPETEKNLFTIMALVYAICTVISFVRAYLTLTQVGLKQSILSWVSVLTQGYLTTVMILLFLI